MSSEFEFKEVLSRKSKVAYGSANTAGNILSGVAFTAITFYYNVKLGLSAELIGMRLTTLYSDILKIEPNLI